MKRRGSTTTGGDDTNQLRIQWSGAVSASGQTASAREATPTNAEPKLVQRLPWDFQESFPKPLPEAIDAGIITDEDAEPENLRAIHQEQGKAMMATLRDMNFIADARRRLFDPRTGKIPESFEEKERLKKKLVSETERLQLWWQTLIDTYAQAFGEEAADAFGKAVRARNTGIDIVVGKEPSTPSDAPNGGEPPPTQPPPIEPKPPADKASSKPSNAKPLHPRMVSARFPVPRPLESAIAAGHFGYDEHGVIIRPSAAEVRSITLQHSEKLIDLLESIEQSRHSCVPSEVTRMVGMFRKGIAAYAEDFGSAAGQQLEAFVRRQARVRANGMAR